MISAEGVERDVVGRWVGWGRRGLWLFGGVSIGGWCRIRPEGGLFFCLPLLPPLHLRLTKMKMVVRRRMRRAPKLAKAIPIIVPWVKGEGVVEDECVTESEADAVGVLICVSVDREDGGSGSNAADEDGIGNEDVEDLEDLEDVENVENVENVDDDDCRGNPWRTQ